MTFTISIIALIVLLILMIDWVWIHRLTAAWMNKLWVIVFLVCFYVAWKLFQIDEMKIAFVAIMFFVFGIGYLLVGLNRTIKRPFRY